MITDEMVAAAAALAKLELTESEKERVKKDLDAVIGFMNVMNTLNTEAIEPLIQVSSLHNVFREDEQSPQDGTWDLLENAPEKRENCFLVPKAVE